MKTNRTGLILISIIIFALLSGGCSEDKITNYSGYEKTLVLMCDFDQSSDLVINIIGNIRKELPNVDVQYYKVREFDIFEASYILDLAVESYPQGTYFAGIVEPGASSRKIVFEAGGKKFILPDNGLGTRIFSRFNPANVYFAENPALIGGDSIEYLRNEIFYKNAITSLLKDAALSEFGTKAEQPVKLDIQEAAAFGDTIRGDILYRDNFGNCIANIPESLTGSFSQGDLIKVITSSGYFFARIGTTYSSVEIGENVAFINSSERLEFAVDYGNLSERYGLAAGSKISVVKSAVKVGILQFNSSSVADDIVAGMKARLSELGFSTGGNLIFVERNANGVTSNLNALLNEILSEGVDILVPVSTPASQVCVKYAPESVPIVFTYVTDPSSAGLLGERAKVSGLSDATNFSDYLNFVKALLPELKNAGRLYNDQESNSVYAQSQITSFANLYGLMLISATAHSTIEIPVAYENIKSRGIEAILIAADNTFSDGIAALSTLCINDKLPLIGDSFQHAENGALAAISVNYEELSKSTGEFVKSVILGINPDDEAVRTFSTDVIAVNTQTAAAINFTIPVEIMDKAKYIYP